MLAKRAAVIPQLQHDLALQAMQLRVEEWLSGLRGEGESRLDCGACVGELSCGHGRLGEQRQEPWRAIRCPVSPMEVRASRRSVKPSGSADPALAAACMIRPRPIPGLCTLIPPSTKTCGFPSMDFTLTTRVT